MEVYTVKCRLCNYPFQWVSGDVTQLCKDCLDIKAKAGTVEELENHIKKLKEENEILYKERNEALKLWDEHKYKLKLAMDALSDIASDYGSIDDRPILGNDAAELAYNTIQEINKE